MVNLSVISFLSHLVTINTGHNVVTCSVFCICVYMSVCQSPVLLFHFETAYVLYYGAAWT